MRDMMGNRMPPVIREEDVGSYWLGPDGEPWLLIAYSAAPTVTWRKVGNDSEVRNACIGSPLTVEFAKLVREDDEE